MTDYRRLFTLISRASRRRFGHTGRLDDIQRCSSLTDESMTFHTGKADLSFIHTRVGQIGSLDACSAQGPAPAPSAKPSCEL
jgi:hypothetical protein